MTSTFDRKVIVALFVVFTLVLTGCAVCIYRAEAAKLSGLRTQLRADTARLADIKSKVDRMPELEAGYQQVAARLEFLETPLPDAAYIPTFLAQIELLARQTNNEIIVIRPKKKAKTAPGAAKGETKINNETGEVIKEDEAAAKTEQQAAKDKPALPYDFIPIEMKIEGTYWTALQFLQQLQRFPKMIAVNSVGFSPRTSGPAATGSDQALAITLDLTAVAMKGAKDGNAH